MTDWLTAGRYGKYVSAAGGDHQRALALYEWNAQLYDNGLLQDKNATPRNSIKQARKFAKYNETNGVHRGKVIAEFMFGFWTYLTDSLHEKTLWVPALHKAYATGADRSKLHLALTDLRDVRNRLAHNESVYDRQPENLRRSIVYVTRHLSEPLREHIEAHSTVSEILTRRPTTPRRGTRRS